MNALKQDADVFGNNDIKDGQEALKDEVDTPRAQHDQNDTRKGDIWGECSFPDVDGIDIESEDEIEGRCVINAFRYHKILSLNRCLLKVFRLLG